ncbi:hypothetical protein MPER_03397 [Moniliophthora perniciosa FA553]|nr:hypothetical protein MPER_03397 [Moniliophthora perniciosa FA553]
MVIANNGKVNYCVRGESSATVNAADRHNVEAALRRSINKWNAWLKGFDGWPYSTLDVNVVGWALSDTKKLEGDVSGIQVYTNVDSEGVRNVILPGAILPSGHDYSGCKLVPPHYEPPMS